MASPEDEPRSSSSTTMNPDPLPPPPPKTRGRARSGSIRINPLAVPLNSDEQSVVNLIHSINKSNAPPEQQSPAAPAPSPTPKFEIISRDPRPPPPREPLPTPDIDLVRGAPRARMSYQNYAESPGGSQASGSRQAPPSPSQNMAHGNGMNGGIGAGGSLVGFPTPAGHQSDLNYIMQMVEDLSRQLDMNQRMTAGVVDKVGKVRERAQTMDLNNDELMALVASEMSDDTKNLEKEISELRKKLEKAEYNSNENWKLVIYGCNILADILDKMHKFKEQHEIDTLAWHKNYRGQLADEREANLNLRLQIDDMKAAAYRANGHLRDMRRYLTDHDELNELRIQNIALRLEKRSWKRMALPHLHDSDSEFSDDDDLIDPEEKKRAAAEAAVAKDESPDDKPSSPGEDAQGI